MTNALKQIQAGTDPLASDLRQFASAFSAGADVGGLSFALPQAVPAAPSAVASGTTGNLNGSYDWKVVLITGWKEDTSTGSYYVSGFVPSAASSSATITNNSASLSGIATGGNTVIGRAIYRTAAGGSAGSEKFVGIIWDNTTTTFTDNIADSSLGTGMPNSSSTPAANGVSIPANVPTTNSTGSGIGASNQDILLMSALEFLIDTRTVNLTYDANGNLTQVVEKDGTTTIKTTTLTFDGNGNLTEVQEIAANKTVTTTLNYDGSGNLSSVTKAVS